VSISLEQQAMDSMNHQLTAGQKATTLRNRTGLPCRSTVTWEERLATHAADARTASMGDGDSDKVCALGVRS
jgi:hypothetical protein